MSADIERVPRLGFAGVGWIGQARMRALLEHERVEVVALADPCAELAEQARALVPQARVHNRFEALLEEELDALVIATPSALHAQQAEAALARGRAVFCQKPLGRMRAEVQRVVEAARRADRLLALDLSYRATAGMRAIKALASSGELGALYHARLVFHNAYGPDKPWYYDVAQAGGGCVMDLGVHLVDLALWLLGFPRVERVESALFAKGQRLAARDARSEDFASVRLDLAGGTVVDLACSWNLPAGTDAVIEAEFQGTHGGAAFHNVNGSFYDFRAARLERRRRLSLAEPPDAWGGRLLVEFVRALRQGAHFRAEAEEFISVAATLDRIYGRS
jgi:predicted dehydrogenase